MSKPIGVSKYKIVESIPNYLRSNLPSIEEFENELEKYIHKLNEKK